MRRIAALGLLVLGACASTQVIDSWKEPSFAGPFKFQKIAVLALSPDESVRRVVEDELVKKIGAEKAVASHTFITITDLKDTEKAKAAVQKAGADGAVTVRLVDKSQEVNYIPGTYMPPSYPLWSYSSYAWSHSLQPGLLTTDTLVRIETNIYGVGDEKLLWSGISESFNPMSVKSAANEVADAVKKKLIQQKLLEEKK